MQRHAQQLQQGVLVGKVQYLRAQRLVRRDNTRLLREHLPVLRVQVDSIVVAK